MSTTKKALVLAGSRGIGKQIVLGLAAKGVHVIFTYASNEAAAREVADEVVRNGGQATAIKADVGNLSELKEAVAYSTQNLGAGFDYFINNAFPSAVFAPTEFMNEDGYDTMFAAVKGHYFALQYAIRHINDGGNVVVISSGAAAMPQPASGAYAGAKSAIEKFALSLSRELGSRQISVNVVSPGVTKTDGLVAPQPMIDMLVAQTPLGRLGEPADVANAVVALCTDGMKWVNGQVIQVNGGIL
jgi:3-oxoacyl-[acyl-carrier protein] reductase